MHKRQRGSTWVYTFKKSGVLAKPLHLTFESEKEGDAYAKRLQAQLDRGIVPDMHLAPATVRTITDLVRHYARDAHLKQKDAGIIETVVKARGSTMVDAITAAWCDDWINEMKREHKFAPATIRAKIGCAARCIDWGMRRGFVNLIVNPLRQLPESYSQYTKLDASLAGGKRVDIERDRRLEPGEHEKILAVIEGGVLARKDRPYVLRYKVAIKSMYLLALETAMRLREMYTLTLDQVQLDKRTVFLEKTKNGDKRQVPMSTVAVKVLQDYLAAREIPETHPDNILFPWWNGQEDHGTLVKMSDYISKFYRGIFEQAGAHDLKFHDLRHEAVSRLFERTALSETEIMKISGHKAHRMIMRYANLRGSDLASKLW